jgi:uncharacterized protein (DUF1015 family)
MYFLRIVFNRCINYPAKWQEESLVADGPHQPYLAVQISASQWVPRSTRDQALAQSLAFFLYVSFHIQDFSVGSLV